MTKEAHMIPFEKPTLSFSAAANVLETWLQELDVAKKYGAELPLSSNGLWKVSEPQKELWIRCLPWTTTNTWRNMASRMEQLMPMSRCLPSRFLSIYHVEVLRWLPPRPVGERDPYLSVQLNHLGDMCSINKLHHDARNDADCSSWVISDGDYTGDNYGPIVYGSNIPKEKSLHPLSCAEHLTMRTLEDVSLAYTLVQLEFPVEQWLKQYPDSIYNVSEDTFKTLVKELPTVQAGESKGASSVEVELPQALAIQELQLLPKDVDKHFCELAKAHPISMKAVRNTEGKVQNAPARMVYVVKPARADDGTGF
eukprot:2754505-Amphidinium_carterae.2